MKSTQRLKENGSNRDIRAGCKPVSIQKNKQ